MAGSLYLVTFLPITLFSEGDAEAVRIDVTMPEGTTAGGMFKEVRQVEDVLAGFVERGYVTSYQVTMGASSQGFSAGSGESGYDIAGFSVALSNDFPPGAVDELRRALPDKRECRNPDFR